MKNLRWLVALAVVLAVLVFFVVRSRSAEPVVASPTAPHDAGSPARPSGVTLHVPRGVVPSAVVAPSATAKPCLRGKVVNAANHAPVANAQLVLGTTRGAVQASSTPAGTFELILEEAGEVEIAEVSASGFFPFRPAWGSSPIRVRAEAGRCVNELLLSLVPMRELRGHVQSVDGKPVGNASITIGSEDEPPGAPLISDAEGNFLFHARDGDTLVARHPAFEPRAESIDFRAAVSGKLLIVLRPKAGDTGVERATLTGVVIDERDGGVAAARVAALQHFGRTSRLEAETETDTTGAFSMQVDGPGPWDLFATLPGIVSAPERTSGKPVTLRIFSATELRGTVRSARGQPVEAFTVTVALHEGPLEDTARYVRHFVDASGAFTLRGIPPGAVQVVVSALGHASSEPVNVALAAGKSTSVDVTLGVGGTITGKVVDRASKQPIAEARVSLESRSESTLSALPSALTAADGAFELPSVPPGRRSLFVAASGHDARLLTVEAIDARTTGPLTIDLAPVKKDEEPKLELVGIGAVLEAKGDALVIKDAIAGGGAALAGLVPGDGILSIDGQPSQKLGFPGAVEKIRGEEGTTLTLEVRRADGTVATIVVTRRRVVN